MAILRDNSMSLGLEIAPVTPSRDGPRDAYNVTVYEEEKPIFQKRYSVADKQMGHYAVRRIARSFRYGSRLINKTLGFPIGDSDDHAFDEPAYLNVDIDWMRVVLYGVTVDTAERLGGEPGSQAMEPRIYVDICLYDDTLICDACLTPYIALPPFYCTPAQTERFGSELLSELKNASRSRQALGLRAPDDLDEEDW